VFKELINFILSGRIGKTLWARFIYALRHDVYVNDTMRQKRFRDEDLTAEERRDLAEQIHKEDVAICGGGREGYEAKRRRQREGRDA
jgi:hypothetical protein